MNSSTAQYPSAIDVETGRPVDATGLFREDVIGREYVCPYCNGKMGPVLGGIRVHHFRHEEGHHCSYDNYLHGYAEEVFMEEYQNCLDKGLPFLLVMDVPVRCNKSCVLKEHLDCKERYNRKTYDLTKEFKKVSKEKIVHLDKKHFRKPDILLEGENGSPLWIEICVSHETDPLDNPGRIRVIEIKINSKEDVDRVFRGHRIVQSKDSKNWVRLHYFSSVVIDEPLQKIPPCEKLFVFEIKHGRVFGEGYITEKNAESPDPNTARLVLQLNWNGSHTGDGNAPAHYTQEELEAFCWSRLHTGKTGDLLVSSLIKEEHRCGVPVITNRETASDGLLKNTPLSTSPLGTNVENLPISRWIDLGLPSGTLWCETDGPGASASIPGYETSPRIPSRADIDELSRYCSQTVSKDEDHVVIRGQNGQSIQLHEGKYQLSDKPRDGGVYYLNIYAREKGNYLHIVDDDYFGKDCDCRFVLYKE